MSAKNTSCVRARAKARACPHVCGSSSGLLKACWEACHCKSGKGKSPKCTEERTHHPPFYIYLSPFLFYSLTLSFFFPTDSFIALHYCSITSASWMPCVDQSEELNVKHIQILLLVLLQNKFLLLLSLFVPLCRWLNYIYWVHSVQEWVHFILKLNDMLSLVNPIIHIRTLHKYHYSDFRLHGLLSLSQGCYMCVKYLTWTVWPVSCLTTRTWPSSWRGNSSV